VVSCTLPRVLARRKPRLVSCLALTLAATVTTPAHADDDWWGRDKALHFGVSAALSAGTYAIAAPSFEARYPPLLLGAGLSLTLGVGKELADLAGLGTPSWKDLTWDVIGTAAGLVLAYGLDLLIVGVSAEHPALGAPTRNPTVQSRPWRLGTQHTPFVFRF